MPDLGDLPPGCTDYEIANGRLPYRSKRDEVFDEAAYDYAEEEPDLEMERRLS